MAKTRQQKQETVTTLTDNLQSAKAVVFANFQGLKIKESDELRKICRDAQISFVVSKKTLVQHVLKSAGFEVDAKQFDGGVATVCGQSDEVAPAQIVANFAKTHNVVKIFGGILEGKFIDSNKVNELSMLPSKQQLLGQLVGTLNAPISGFVNVLAGNLRNLVNVLNNIKEAKV